ncbi:unnamed protein product [Prunus armeniaca]
MRRTACAATESSKLMQDEHWEIPSYSRFLFKALAGVTLQIRSEESLQGTCLNPLYIFIV